MSILPQILPTSILPKILPRNEAERQAAAERQLIHLESQYGRTIFGPIPANHHRDFFCLDEFTCIWHEDWIDGRGHRHVISTRYVLRPDGAIKSLNNGPYQRVEKEESKHLHLAIRKYVNHAQAEYSRMLQVA